MSNEYNCFVISPVGEPNSKIREAADALLEYLVIPALRNCNFSPDNIVRADRLYSSGSINSAFLYDRNEHIRLYNAYGNTAQLTPHCHKKSDIL